MGSPRAEPSGKRHVLAPINLQQPLLCAIQNTPMVKDLQILRLCLEHLVRLLTWTEWIRTGTWIHLRHLLCHLTCRVLIAKDEDKDALQAEQAQEVP